MAQAISHYRIIRKLGAGGMGEVYLAEDTRLHRKVAIKLLPSTSASDEQARKRLIREARAAAQLDHPNICAIHEVGEDASFIVMQYVEGETLAATLRTRGLELKESLDIAIQILSALSDAHGQGIIHRDIKPQNVIITPRGQVKVLDFGLAKTTYQRGSIESEAETESILTESGMVVGTVGYMSPEQAKGANLDARSDLFSVGALLYECVTGRPAFTGNNLIDICAQVIHVDPPAPSKLNADVSQGLDSVIVKSLAKAADARYQTADELREDLSRVRDTGNAGLQVSTTPETLKPTTTRITAFATLSKILRKRSPSATVAMVLSLVAVIGVLVVPRLWRTRPHQPLPAARQWYDRGTNYLRDGAYYQASKALEQAIAIDNEFALAHARLAEAWSELDYSERAKDEMLKVSALVPDRSALPKLEGLYLQAVTGTVTRNFASVIESYRNLIEQVPEQDKAFAYVDLGRAYEKNEELNSAIESYREGAKRDPQNAAAFLRLAILSGRQQDFVHAAEEFDTAESLYKALSNDEGRAEVYYQRGTLLNSINKLSEARIQLQKVLDETSASDNKYQRIKTMLQLSSIYGFEGNVTLAQQCASEAMQSARIDGLENLTTNGLIDLGNTFFIRGEYSEAESYFRQAVQVAQTNKGRYGEARGLLSLGSLLINRGNVDEGLVHVTEALSFYQKGGYRKQTSQALILIGQAYRKKGEYDASLQAFKEQLQFADEVNDRSGAASAHSSMGNLLTYREQYVEALFHYEESYKINQVLNARFNIGYDLLQRSEALWQLGRYSEAQSALTQAESIADPHDSNYSHLRAEIQLVTGDLAFSERRFQAAKTASQQALALAGTQYKDVIVAAKRTLGLSEALAGAKRKGQQLCQEAYELATQLGDPTLRFRSLLALAEVMLESGDAQGARLNAIQAQESFNQFGQPDSEWRACLIAARAERAIGDETKSRGYASRARDLLAKLEKSWGTEVFNRYSDRPDIRYYRKQLSEILAVKTGKGAP